MCSLDECGSTDRRDLLKAAVAIGLAWPASLNAAGRTTSSNVEIPTPVGAIKGYLARPSGSRRRPAVIVLNTDFGLPDWAKAVADELARAGFVALALSFLSRFPDVTREALRQEGKNSRFLTEAFAKETEQENLGAVRYLARLPFVRADRIGVVGFCGGGVQAVRLSIAAPELKAVVSFYGPPALSEQFKNPRDPMTDLVEVGSKVRTPLQIHHGTDDYAVKGPDVSRLVEEVRAAGGLVESYAYEGATHAFYSNRDTPANVSAATLAHERYLRFLHGHLG